MREPPAQKPWEDFGCTPGLTSGVFDLVHIGHIRYLMRCRARCTTLFVGVDSDDLVRQTKGPTRPIIPEDERLEMVRSIAYVHTAFIVHDLQDLRRVSMSFGVKKVFKHEGFQKTPVVGVEGTQAELVIIPDVPGLVSTTEIINRVLKRVSNERNPL